MASNRGVVYAGPGKVEVQAIDYPKLINPRGRTANHGVILKVLTTNIFGSDQHMVRGRATAPTGLVLGHEITGCHRQTVRNSLDHLSLESLKAGGPR